MHLSSYPLTMVPLLAGTLCQPIIFIGQYKLWICWFWHAIWCSTQSKSPKYSRFIDYENIGRNERLVYCFVPLSSLLSGFYLSFKNIESRVDSGELTQQRASWSRARSRTGLGSTLTKGKVKKRRKSLHYSFVYKGEKGGKRKRKRNVRGRGRGRKCPHLGCVVAIAQALLLFYFFSSSFFLFHQ